LEGIHGRIRYLGRKGEFREHKRSNQRIREGISTRYGRCGMARAQRKYVPKKRTTRKVHGKDAIRVVGQEIRSGILGRLERNWRRWKGKKLVRRGTMKTILEEEEEVEEEKSGVREWTEEDEDEMGNMVDLYYEL